MAKFERKFDVNSFFGNAPHRSVWSFDLVRKSRKLAILSSKVPHPHFGGGSWRNLEIFEISKYRPSPKMSQMHAQSIFCYGKVKWNQMKCFLATCLFSQKLSKSETSTICTMLDICQHLTFLTLHLLESEVYRIFFWKSISEQISHWLIIYDLVEICNLSDPKNVWSSKNPFPRWFWMVVKGCPRF